ncbi:MAG TPA: hypothetical protein VMT22_24810, partial [Terriglobales bacterium]|nr:hypothetical protein [Terriglobales bacterium]
TIAPNGFVNERLQDPQIQNLIQRTRHIKEESLTVILKNGKKLTERFQPIANLTDWPRVREKFVQNMGELFSQERTQSIIDGISDLEELATIQQLTNLLRTD